jgi:hypothetical protein
MYPLQPSTSGNLTIASPLTGVKSQRMSEIASGSPQHALCLGLL